jgi:exosortase
VLEWRRWLPAAITAVAFITLFFHPLSGLALDWWRLPEAGHGLLLAPVAIWLAWRNGLDPEAKPQVALGAGILIAAVALRYTAGLAAELFMMRGAVVGALIGLTVYYAGVRQVTRWWLSFVLVILSIPLPELITQAIALPLQFKASQMGAALLEMRNVPVLVSGNVIRIPGQELFVTEACSGLRSLTALISTAILMGALLLKAPVSRVFLVLIAIPVAILVNGLRVFLTGFLVHFVSPSAGTGFMHVTEGWLLFLVSLTVLFAFGAVALRAERWIFERRARVQA